MSVHPRYATALLDGTKTVEIRRSRTRLTAGDVVLIYATSPVRQLVGAVTVTGATTRAPSTIWGTVGTQTGLRRSEFDSYLDGSATATAISVADRRTFPDPVPLAELRARQPGFVVPQSYRYLDSSEARNLLNGEARTVFGLAGP